MEDIDWNEVRRISRWYTWKYLKRYSFVLGSSEIVSEAMLSLVKMDKAKWSEMALTTVVCNHTRWSAYRLYYQHKKNLRLDASIAFARESYCVDVSEELFAEDFRKLVASAKAKVVGQMREKIGNSPKKPAALSRWKYKHRDLIRKIARYESGFIEQRVVEQETLEVLAHHFGVTRERARQIEGKFWGDIRNVIRSIYDMPWDYIGDLLIVGEVISEPYVKKDILLGSD